MKRHTILTIALAATALLGFAGCSEELEPPEILNFTVTPDTMNAGDTITGDVETLNFELASHAGGDAGDVHHDGNAGHFHVYLDDLMTNPLVMPDENPFEIPMPVDATPGQHSLIVRLQNLDHTILEPQVTFTATITVQ